MAAKPDPNLSTGNDEEIKRLRARVAELEGELRAARRAGHQPRADEAAKGIAAVTAALALLLAPPAFLTFRRWWRWWVQ